LEVHLGGFIKARDPFLRMRGQLGEDEATDCLAGGQEANQRVSDNQSSLLLKEVEKVLIAFILLFVGGKGVGGGGG